MQVELAIPVYGSTQYLNFIKNINQAHTHGGVDLTLLHKMVRPNSHYATVMPDFRIMT